MYKGKAIYNPSGKAGEYSYWACNFYAGCSNGCTYCYLKKGVLAHAMGHNTPQLKKCFTSEEHALQVFNNELVQNLPQLQQHGLFFSFTTDPMLPETIDITLNACGIAVHNYNVPVKILTKCTQWVDDYLYFLNNSNSDNESHQWRKKIAFGFTLTGHDELEPEASTNQERINAMRTLHNAGFKTFASIEPVIDFNSSLQMIIQSLGYVDLYKIGLQSGKKYDKNELHEFFENANSFQRKIYWKDSLLAAAGINRANLPANCVPRSYNIFTGE